MNLISMIIKLESILEVDITELASRDSIALVVFGLHVMVESVFCRVDSAAFRTGIF